MTHGPTLSPRSNIFSRGIARSAARRPATSPYRAEGSAEASTEIQAYMSARDMALSEAERGPSDLSLNRAFLANEIVERCLKFARTPYQAQCLPEGETSRAQGRCEAVKHRLQQLRSCVLAAA
jgi:hypothetical protein